MKNSIFIDYDISNLETLCSEVWPIVNDYLINEIDDNSVILKASIESNKLSGCIEYICSEEQSAFFRTGRSVFSVIIRLYQTNQVNSLQLEKAFVDNEPILQRWFSFLILHAQKTNFSDIAIKAFCRHLSYFKDNPPAKFDPFGKKLTLPPFKIEVGDSITLELTIFVKIKYNIYKGTGRAEGGWQHYLRGFDSTQSYSPSLTYSVFLPYNQIKSLKRVGITILEEIKQKSLGLLIKTKTVPFTKSNLNTVFPAFFDSKTIESEFLFTKSLNTFNYSLNDKSLTRLLDASLKNVLQLQTSYTPEKLFKFIKNGRDSFLDIRYEEPRTKKKKVDSLKLNATLEGLILCNNIDVNKVVDLYGKKLPELSKVFREVDEHKLMLNCLATVWVKAHSVNVTDYVVRCINIYSSNTQKEDTNWIAIGFKSELAENTKKPLTNKDSLLVIYDTNRLFTLHGTVSKENYNAHAIFSQYDDRILIPKDLVTKMDLNTRRS